MAKRTPRKPEPFENCAAVQQDWWIVTERRSVGPGKARRYAAWLLRAAEYLEHRAKAEKAGRSKR